MKLSVVIPAYDPPGQYLENILETLSKHRRKDMEIIVVDDGSHIDLSWVRKYARLVRQPNGGEGKVRNRCLDEAKGEYIQFLDADDIITDDALDIIYENIEAGYDWVSYNWFVDGGSGGVVQRKDTPFLNYAVWAYTFKRSFIEGVRFREDWPVGADTDWLDRLPKGGNHRHDPRVWYNYRFAGNEQSLCHRNMRGEFK